MLVRHRVEGDGRHARRCVPDDRVRPVGAAVIEHEDALETDD